MNCIFVDVGWFEFDYWFTQRVKDNPRLNVKFKVHADAEGQQLLKKYVGNIKVLYLKTIETTLLIYYKSVAIKLLFYNQVSEATDSRVGSR